MIDCSFMTLNMILSLVLAVLSVTIPFLQICVEGGTFRQLPEMILKYVLFFNVGCLFLLGGAGQFLYGPEISTCIGWGWSPFQYELAFSELGLSILGLICPLFHKEFWLATTIAASVWLLGGSAVHIYYLALGNMALLNASFVIVWNLVLVFALSALYGATIWSKKLANDVEGF